MRKCKKGWRILFLPLIAAAVLGFGYLTMYLWNELMPYLFHLPVISFWQAVGILLLSRLLFGFGGHHRSMHERRHNHLREKWEKMTPEEREKFRGQWSHWACCGQPSASEDQGKKE